MKTSPVVVAVLAVALALGAASCTSAPAPPLIELGEGGLARFKADFNAAADRTRVVALLSPT